MSAQRMVMLAALLFGVPAAAQDQAPPADASQLHTTTLVYKCTNPDGSVVYAEKPCSTDPNKVQTIDTSPALRTGSGGFQGEIAASVADSDCRDRAYKSTHADQTQIDESNRHIADYQQRIQDLQAQPGAYGTTDNSQAIADLEGAIAKEREFQAKSAENNEAAYQNALRLCDEELRKATQPAPEKPAPPAQPPARSDQDAGG